MTNVLMIMGELHPFGGLQRHVVELLERLAQDTECKASLIATNINGKKDSSKLIRELKVPFEVTILNCFGLKSIRILTIKSLVSIARQIRCADVIHLHDVRFGLILAIVFRKKTSKIILSSHGFIFHTGNTEFKKIAFLIMAKIMNMNGVSVICVSNTDYARAKLYHLKKKFYIPNWTNEKFTPCSNKDKSYFLYFGRLEDSKGVNELLSVNFRKFLQSKNMQLKIIGSGSLYDEAVRVSEEDANVQVIGDVTDKVKNEYLKNTQYCIFPSKYEGFGITVLEALAKNCTCLLNKNSNYHKIFKNAPVRFFTFGTFSELDLAEEKMTEASRKDTYLKKYTLDNALSKIKSVYRS